MLRYILSLLALLALASDALAGEIAVRKRLASVQDNVQAGQWQHGWTSPDGARVTISQRMLSGGKQEGVSVIEVNNGKLTFIVIPTRGMNVLSVTLGDVRLGWDSPVKEVVHPKFINLQARNGLGWLEGFNEWMVRCGLEYAGHPGTDKFVNNTGDESTMELTLHGKIGNIPASEVEVIVDATPPHRIRVRGRVDERGFYGPQLEVSTEISTVPGSSELRIDDIVTNHGADDQEFQVIYHTNYGRPLLEAGARALTPVRRVTPMNGNAAAAIDTYETYVAPTKGFAEQVYLIEPLSDDEGKTMVLLQNAQGNRGTSIRWSTSQLPYLTIWKNTAATEAGYVTGLEPGTGFPFNRRVERHFGRVPKLAPGQQRQFSLEFAIYSDAESVQKTAARIRAIQGGHKPTIVREAPDIKELVGE